MTTIGEALDGAATVARRIKEDRARKADSDLPTALIAYRGTEQVAHVYPLVRQGRDAMVACARVAARGFGLDVLAMVFETFIASSETNPITGQPWRSGELNEVAGQHQGVAKGWVTDTVMVAVYNRAGDSATRLMPYRIVAKTVVWSDLPVPAEGGRWGGMVHEALVRIMTTEPTVPQMLAMDGLGGADFGLDAEETITHTDVVTAKTFADRSNPAQADVMLVAAPGTRRAEILHRWLPGGRIVRP